MTIRRILFILLLVQSILLSAQNLWKKRYFQDGFGDNTSQPFLCANYPGKSNSLDVYLSMRVYDSERYGLFLEMRIAEELYGPEMISNPIQVSAKFKGQVYNLPVNDVVDNITIILETDAQKKLIDLLSSNSYDDLKVSIKHGDTYQRNCIFNINCPTGLKAELKKSGIIKPSTSTPSSSTNKANNSYSMPQGTSRSKSIGTLLETCSWSSTRFKNVKVPSFMTGGHEVEVAGTGAEVTTWGYDDISLSYWPALGSWAALDFPDAGHHINAFHTIKNVTYSNKKGVFSGYTNDGRIYYLKTITTDIGITKTVSVLALVYPKSRQNEVGKLINYVAKWPSTTYTNATATKTNSQSSASTGNQAIIKFLKGIYEYDDFRIFSDEWVYKHCSTKMQKKLREEYIFYEGEPSKGWGSQYIAGRRVGEDIGCKTVDVTYSNGYYYASLEPRTASYYLDGFRVLRFSISLVNGVPVIDECQWVEDFTYRD